jgi:hypothetical protein
MTPHERKIRASASELKQNLAEECGELLTDGPIGLGTRYEAEFLQGVP